MTTPATDSKAPHQPLTGLRVVDCSTVLAGPYCTMILADLGADVIKVEPPDGDVTRTWGPPWIGSGANRTAAYYLAINRNKRSIVLDLRTPDGADVLRRLLDRADVFVENFRPGGLDRLGFGDDDLARLNPRLVHAAVSGYGLAGPDAGKPGYDFVAQATGGLMSITGDADADGGHPLRVGIAISDVTTGLFAAIGVLASLAGRTSFGSAAAPGSGGPVHAHGSGGASAVRVDVSLLESTLALLINQAQNAFATGRSPVRSGNAHPNIVPYQTFDTADIPIVVAVGSDRQWPRFCEALGVPELASDRRFRANADRVTNRRVLESIVAPILAARPAAEWLAILDAADVPCGPINGILEAVESEQARARSMDLAVDHPVLGRIRQVGPPIKLNGSATRPHLAPPLLGEHTAEILRELGYDAATVARLTTGARAPGARVSG